ncbi:MAG: GAF domain-containing protein [Bacilli bacterium]|nr:GAF domain-containing protein [Bacilli bacterium]
MSLLSEQIKSIVDKSYPLVTNLANSSAILKDIKGVDWVGFYIVEGDHLYLGPFQGDPACSIINIGRGVCGESFLNKVSINVPDVSKLHNYIACSSKTKSELVVPIMKNDEVVALIDLDSDDLSSFSDSLQKEIEEIANLLSELF